MPWLKWIIVAVGSLLGVYMAFDGCRALTVGDYLTPRQGPYGGQLGPWAGLLRGAGLEPRSNLVKTGFVVYGICWLALALSFAAGKAWSWLPLVILSALSLWYVPVGTGLAAVPMKLRRSKPVFSSSCSFEPGVWSLSLSSIAPPQRGFWWIPSPSLALS